MLLKTSWVYVLNISAILSFRRSRLFASNKTCFSSKEKGEAIAKALIVSSRLCFSKAFQFITKPLFSNKDFRSLKINLRSLFEKRGFVINWEGLEKQSLDETINALAMASPFSLEEKQVLLEAKNLDVRKNKISEILSTYTHDVFSNTTLQ